MPTTIALFPRSGLGPARARGCSRRRAAALPELPERRRIRFESSTGLSAYDARLLSVSRSLADFFEAVVAARVPAKTAANWILRDVLQALKEREQEIEETKLTPEALAALLRLLEEEGAAHHGKERARAVDAGTRRARGRSRRSWSRRTASKPSPTARRSSAPPTKSLLPIPKMRSASAPAKRRS